MISRQHKLSINKQCQVLQLARSSFYYQPKAAQEDDFDLMKKIDEIHLRRPFLGVRRITDELHLLAERVNHKRVYRYWHSRKVLSWRLSNTLDVSFCTDALEEALHRYGKPEIFNSDQGSQYTSEAFIGLLKDNDIRISMDGRGAWRDNVMIERLWRSVKYEEVYLNAYDDTKEAKKSLAIWFDYYNQRRQHQTLKNTPDAVYSKHCEGKTAA